MSDDLYQHPQSTSADGFLVGGNPEHGDIVYAADGAQLGRVAFFYEQSPNDKSVFLVKLDDDSIVKDDPIAVQVQHHSYAEPVVEEIGGKRVSTQDSLKRLVYLPGVAHQHKYVSVSAQAHSGGTTIGIGGLKPI